MDRAVEQPCGCFVNPETRLVVVPCYAHQESEQQDAPAVDRQGARKRAEGSAQIIVAREDRKARRAS